MTIDANLLSLEIQSLQKLFLMSLVLLMMENATLCISYFTNLYRLHME